MDYYDQLHYRQQHLTSDPKNTGFKVGDKVQWTNAAGIKWEHTIIGFNYTSSYQKKYESYVHLNKDAYWMPISHKDLTKVN
mgnify:CR=1 FL=1|tara:strand:+ start:272 stop:514 length:243 start_codon:yes stop_codon:yes gene_type:complete